VEDLQKGEHAEAQGENKKIKNEGKQMNN